VHSIFVARPENPSSEELATRIGIKQEFAKDRLFDLAIVGGGRRD
jgi:hypothetical protein